LIKPKPFLPGPVVQNVQTLGAGGYPPAPPQTRTSTINAYGSSGNGFAPGAIRGCIGYISMITVYHSCFSTTGPFPDRPLPYSQAPSGCVRLLSVGTMRQLRLPCLSCVTSFVALCRNTSGRFPAFARHRGEIAAPTPGCCLTGVTLCLPVSSPKDAFGSPKFPANPSCICPVLRLRPGLYARLSRRFGVVLAQQDGEDPSDALSKLNHTAFALAVYASCRPLGRRRKTRFR